MAGYSGTPLIKKLGIKSGFNVAFLNLPSNFAGKFDLPPDVTLDPAGAEPLDFAMLFVKHEKDLQKHFQKYAAKLKFLPRRLHRACRTATRARIRVPTCRASLGSRPSRPTCPRRRGQALRRTGLAIGLAAGLVDVKVCAIDDVWSGLKFVFRLKDRPKSASK